MKFKISKKYLFWGLTALVVFILSICFVFVLYRIDFLMNVLRKILSVSSPIIYGLIIAYLLAPILNFIEEKMLCPLFNKKYEVLSKKKRSRIRLISMILTLIFVGLLIFAFTAVVIPQVYYSILDIYELLPTYVDNLIAFGEKVLIANPDIEKYVVGLLESYSNEISEWINAEILPKMNDVLVSVTSSVLGVIKVLWNLVLGLIISIYLLASKERFIGQIKKVMYSLFGAKKCNNVLEDLRFVNKTFGGFIGGKLLDSLIIGLLCFACISVMGMPYPVLISVIIGVTNVIPFFGPFLGAIPSALLVLVVDPMQCLYFLIFILLLQQFDGNFLGPLILGDSTGLSSFWVIFVITTFGGLFGVLGMLLGVPVFAVLYAFFKRKINRGLEKRGYPTETLPYVNLKEITKEKEVVLFEDEHHASPHSMPDEPEEEKTGIIKTVIEKIKDKTDDDDSDDDSDHNDSDYSEDE